MKDLLRSEFSMHLREMAGRVRLIGAVALVAGATVIVLGLTRTQVYESDATVRVSLTDTGADDGTITEFQARSLAQLVPSDSFLSAAIRQSGDSRSITAVRSSIAVEPQETPGFLRLTAVAATPEAAASLANAAAKVLDRAALSDASAQSAGVEVSVVEAASAQRAEPTVTIATTIGEGIAVALLAAIVVGEALVAWRLARGRFSPIAPAAELERLLGAPVLDLRPGIPGADIFPFFHANLRDRPVLTLLNLGDTPSHGVVRRLAKTAGDVHRRVLLIDGDAGRPTLHEEVGHVGPGAVELVQGLRSFRSVLQPAGGDIRAFVLQIGRSRPGSPSGLQLLAGIRDSLDQVDADQVIVSATRSSSLDELVVLAHTFPDGVVLALDPAVHTSRYVRDLTDRLHRVDAVVIACVLCTGSAS